MKGDADLLETVQKEWSEGCVPLFVSEGTSAQKVAAISRSPYLSVVHKEVIPKLERNVVAYGLSFSTNDQRIVDALAKSEVKRLAISIYAPESEDGRALRDQLSRVFRKAQAKFTPEFFDAASAGCWANPPAQ